MDEKLLTHLIKRESKKVFPVSDVREELRLLADSMSTHKALADKIGISPAYLSDVLAGRREPGPAILKFLKLEAVTLYREVK